MARTAGIPLIPIPYVALVVSCIGWCTAAQAQQTPPVVLAHYYTWWDALNKPGFPLKPSRGWYINQTPPYQTPVPSTIFRDQIRDARAGGLAGFAFEWMGPQSPETQIILNGPVAANNALPAEQRMRYILTFDTTIWAMAYQHIMQHWYEPIVFDEAVAEAFSSAVSWVSTTLPSRDPNFASSYLHIDGRPAVFVYNAHSFAGQWQQAIELTRQKAAAGGGIFLIGDFEVSPHPYFDQKRVHEYPAKAALYDAVSNYTLFSGWTFFSLHEYIQQGCLQEALHIGRTLGSHSLSGRYYPGIIAQYFKSRALAPGETGGGHCPGQLNDRVFMTDGSAGYFPVYWGRPEESVDSVGIQSRCELRRLLSATVRSGPELVLVTSWNEPVEGTMIEPSQSPNPACYTMGSDFLDLLARFVPGGGLSVPVRADLDLDGDVDQEDFGLFQACMTGSGALPTDVCCAMAELDGQPGIDQSDFRILQRCLSGTNVPADPACGP